MYIARCAPVIDDLLLEVLACPRCESRPPVRQAGEFLVCTECGLGYPIVDGIPQMLPESAIQMQQAPQEQSEGDSDG
jgi:uncharacterized protein YbaR (Trm112 family)